MWIFTASFGNLKLCLCVDAVKMKTRSRTVQNHTRKKLITEVDLLPRGWRVNNVLTSTIRLLLKVDVRGKSSAVSDFRDILCVFVFQLRIGDEELCKRSFMKLKHTEPPNLHHFNVAQCVSRQRTQCEFINNKRRIFWLFVERD